MHISVTTVKANSVSRIEGAFLQKYFPNYKEMFKGVQFFFLTNRSHERKRMYFVCLQWHTGAAYDFTASIGVAYILHLFSRKQHTFILIQIVPLYACYMFRPVLRPSSGMSIQISFKGNIINFKGPLFAVNIFITLKRLFVFGPTAPQWARALIHEVSRSHTTTNHSR
jgi:hypothetical protein